MDLNLLSNLSEVLNFPCNVEAVRAAMARFEVSSQANYMQAEVLRSNRMSTVLGSSLESGISSTNNPWPVHTRMVT